MKRRHKVHRTVSTVFFFCLCLKLLQLWYSSNGHHLVLEGVVLEAGTAFWIPSGSTNSTNIQHGCQSSSSSPSSAMMMPKGNNVSTMTHYATTTSGTASTTSSRIELLLPATGPDKTIIDSLREEMPTPQYLDEFQANSCNATCQVKIIVPPTSAFSSVCNDDYNNHHHSDNNNNNQNNSSFYSDDHVWEIQALDVNGNPKTMGGDEFYVTYLDPAAAMMMEIEYEQATFNSSNSSSSAPSSVMHHPTAVAEVTDLKNGRYRLSFIESPLNHRHRRRTVGGSMNMGILTVTLQYTCGIGNMYPPSKNHWRSGGHNVVRQWATTTMLLPPPIIKPFQPPNQLVEIIDLFRNAKSIVTIGDSILQQFISPLKLNTGNIGMCLNTTMVPKWTDHLDRKFGMKLQQHGAVLLASSHAWDILEAWNVGGLDDHKAAMRIFVEHVRTTYPNVILIWKGPMAVHIHVPILKAIADDPEFIQQSNSRHRNQSKRWNRLRYMSSSRSWDLYQTQKQLCKELNIPFLDVYQASYLSADHTKVGDGRHYLENLNTMMVHWFIKETIVERVWQNYVGSLSSKRKIFRVVIPPTSNNNIKKDCNLLGKNEFFWTALVNAAIQSILTNSRLEIVIEESVGSKKRQCIEDNMFHPQFLAATSSPSETTTTNANGDRLHVNEVVLYDNNSFGKIPWTLERLKSEEVVPENSFAHQMAKDLFCYSPMFLYGMILNSILQTPILHQDATSEHHSEREEAHYLDPSKNIILAVYDGDHGDGDNNNWKDVHSCVNSVVERLTHPFGGQNAFLDCLLFFSSHDSVRHWKESASENDYKCSPSSRAVSVVTPKDGKAKEEEKSHEKTNYLVAYSYAQIVADTAYDGLIVMASSSSTKTSSSPSLFVDNNMFLSLAQYLRFENARRIDRLPVEDDWVVNCKEARQLKTRVSHADSPMIVSRSQDS